MSIRNCKICRQVEFAPWHMLEQELNRICTEKGHAERKGDLETARYWAQREDVIRKELFTQLRFAEIGYHDFEPEDNLDMIERLAKEKGLV